MYKNFLIFCGIFIALVSAYLYKNLLPKRTLITPYPYYFSENFQKEFPIKNEKSIKSAQSSKILIMGDEMGLSLNPFLPGLLEEFKTSLKNPPAIYNWSEKKEGLHRTLFKIKQLKKLPPIIIYFGAGSELAEKTFSVVDKKSIFYNFNQYDNEKIISLIITFPILSKYFYRHLQYEKLDQFSEYKSLEASTLKLEEKEISFKLFDYHLRELIDYIKENNSQLILITTPINLLTAPKETCAHASSDKIVELQQEIEKEIYDGAYKVAYPKILELSKVTYSNAQSFYLLGKSAIGIGNQKLARESLLKANAFDCLSWRGNPVYNAILKTHAKNGQLEIIDFEQLMSSNLEAENFFDEIFPQNIFYQSVMKDLAEMLKKILSLNQ